jgi:hypothetical protein
MREDDLCVRTFSNFHVAGMHHISKTRPLDPVLSYESSQRSQVVFIYDAFMLLIMCHWTLGL